MTASPRSPWAWIGIFSLFGFLLRAGTSLLWPTIHRPDETFQNLEPAYRLLTGSGVVSWEWRDGIRTWLFPDFLFAIMRAAQALHLPLLPAVAVVLSAIASAAIPVAALLGWRRFGTPGAVICGTLAATWPDLVYFGPKPLLEVQSATLLFLAAGLASLDQTRSTRRLAAIGLLLGLAFDLRFQLAPAFAVVAIGAAGRGLRRGWLPLLASAAAPIVLLGLTDWLTWGSPFQSIWKNIDINFFHNRSAIYGVEPIYWYGAALIGRYGIITVPLAVCFGFGIRAAPLMAATALVVVAFHSLIAHKEISFVYAALPCALVVVGLGATRLLTALVKTGAASSRALGAAILTCAAAAAGAGRAAHPFREPAAQPEIRTLWQIARASPDLCGLGLYAPARFPWVLTPGYVGLQRATPIYLLRGPEALALAAPAFNYLLVDAGADPTLPDGQTVACDGKFCLLHRDHLCEPRPDFMINPVIQRLGQ